MRTLDSYNPAEVAEGRRRVDLGAKFFNEHFPGWQERLLAVGKAMYMDTYCYCATAIAARYRIGPSGAMMFTHGDVGREYGTAFDSKALGCTPDRTVNKEVLLLCWLEAANTVVPLPPKRTWWQKLRDRSRLREAQYLYGRAELAY